ncbi:MAG: glycosyltransferase [Granulosicoccaceae bacterium]
MKNDLTILVFSFNRGQFLRNCIASIERYAPDSKVLIVDDLSDEPETQQVLQELGQRYRIWQPELDSNQHKLGGLYANMQSAFENLPDDALVCCLQDDMQLVRDIRERDIADMQSYFKNNPNAGFLHHAFMKGHQRARYIRTTRFDPDQKVYLREADGKRVGEYFSAVFTARVDRLKSKGWSFGKSEKANNQKASATFDRMGFMRNPFAHWLPCVPSHRHKRKSWAIKVAEKRTGAGFYPFSPFEATTVEDFLSRDDAVLPIAEDFLSTTPMAPVNPWIYHPLQGAPRWLYLAHRIESKYSKN